MQAKKCIVQSNTGLSEQKQGTRVVVDNLGVRLVEAGSQVRLRSGQANGIGNALAQRSCSGQPGVSQFVGLGKCN